MRVRKEAKSMAEGLISGLKDALAYRRGKRTFREHAVELPGRDPAAQAMRRRTKEIVRSRR
jgi:hypothetical protein